MFVVWCCLGGTQFLSYWPKLATSKGLLPSDSPIVESLGPNQKFGHRGATHYKRFLTNTTKHTEKPS